MCSESWFFASVNNRFLSLSFVYLSSSEPTQVRNWQLDPVPYDISRSYINPNHVHLHSPTESIVGTRRSPGSLSTGTTRGQVSVRNCVNNQCFFRQGMHWMISQSPLQHSSSTRICDNMRRKGPQLGFLSQLFAGLQKSTKEKSILLPASKVHW